MPKLGATGEFPRGKLNESDEGELKIAIAVKDDKVLMDFGKLVKWIGMDKQMALNLGKCLIDKANSIQDTFHDS